MKLHDREDETSCPPEPTEFPGSESHSEIPLTLKPAPFARAQESIALYTTRLGVSKDQAYALS